MDKTLNEIADRLGGTVVGEGATRVTGLSGLKEASKGDLSFLADPRYESLIETTMASAILVPSDYAGNGIPMIRVAQPYAAFANLLKDTEKEHLRHPRGIHATAIIGEDVVLGSNVSIGAYAHIENGSRIGKNTIIYSSVYVGHDTIIGADTIIYPNTTLRERVTIGNRCIVHGNATIGSDGFGFTVLNGERVKIPQVGTVVLGDDVEVGSNTSIDRSTIGATTIGNGTKIDNLVQIGHNVTIGEHCTISGGTGIAGSTKIGNRVVMGGQVGISGHLEIGDDVMIGAQAGITKSIPANSIVNGTPHRDHRETLSIWSALPYLPKALKRLRALEKRVDRMEE